MKHLFHNAHDGDRIFIPKELADMDIASLHYRSQDVEPNGLFFAIQGLQADGHDYIPDAAARGATAVVAQKRTATPLPAMITADSRKALALAAANFYGNPSQDLFIVAVTGTNGKTTTAYLVESILQKAGFSVGVIGTINYRFDGRVFKNPVTTPESLDLQRILHEMKGNGVTHVVMEVSSHALDLWRVAYCWMDVGVFTNLTQDHLDYHVDMERYWECKKSLFTDFLKKGPKKDLASAVINCRDPRGETLSHEFQGRVVCSGTFGETAVQPRNFTLGTRGIQGTVITPKGIMAVASPLVGDHNLENILSAAGVGIAMDLDLSAICEGIEAVRCIPGRLERVSNGIGRHVYIDYAHTPDALENVLQSLGRMAENRLICVFGCGGDRDRKKRPQMGSIAVHRADLAIITSDNPRTENPGRIIDDITTGIEKSKYRGYRVDEIKKDFSEKGYLVEPDRKKAIRIGIQVSKPGDIVLIAGKGHETYQIIGKKTIAFDDRKEAERALQETL